jgi:hypothetical protein
VFHFRECLFRSFGTVSLQCGTVLYHSICVFCVRVKMMPSVFIPSRANRVGHIRRIRQKEDLVWIVFKKFFPNMPKAFYRK